MRNNQFYKNFLLWVGICIVLLSLTQRDSYAASLSETPEIKQFATFMAEKFKYDPSYVYQILRKAQYNPDVIRRIESPYEAKPWNQYEKLFVTDDRIAGGVRYWNRSSKLLAWEEREYAVPANIIIAILGIESKYGKEMGDYNVLDALTTLAFHYPPQKKFFQSELAYYIIFTKIYELPANSIKGSYSGAMGQGQFMPSTMLHYIVDFHRNNRPNLFKDKADIIFSIGNYLRQNGWEPEQPVAVPAKFEGNQYKEILKTDLNIPQKPTMSLAHLARYKVYPASGNYDLHLRANLIELQGAKGPEYWLAFHNFYVLTTYNAHDLYAMAVYALSTKIEQSYNDANYQAELRKQQQTDEENDS